MLQGYRDTLSRFSGKTWPALDSLNALAATKQITQAAGLPLRFVSDQAPGGQRAYERQIQQTGNVPTRPENWHDFFNACVWLTFPRLKSALNRLHCEQPESKDRSQRSDAATVFDESGAVLVGPDPRLAQWLAEHNWHRAFVTERSLWQTHRLLIVGHAVLEKSLSPYPGMIVKVAYQAWDAPIATLLSPDGMANLDKQLAQRWQTPEFPAPAALFPLPVLGVPGMDPANEDPHYYDNTQVFRPLTVRCPAGPRDFFYPPPLETGSSTPN